MASFNRVIMMGNLTRDPELKQVSSGQGVCRLGLASNRQFKNRMTGEMVQEVCYIDIDVWGGQAESCNRYLQKGRAVLVEGRIKFDSWQDQDGNRRSKHSVVADRVTFLSSQLQGDAPAASSDESFDTSSFSAAPAEPTAKKEAAAATDAPAPAKAGEVQFKDQEPFKDDLPF